MGRLLTTRRSQWLPGVALLGVAIGLGSFLGFGRAWALLCGLAVGALITSWLRGRLQGRQPEAPRDGERLRLIRGGRDREGYDLARDDSTDEQRWPM
jgi:hypothetical protein